MGGGEGRSLTGMTQRDPEIDPSGERFQDPALRGAVRQVWGQEQCPEKLRQQCCCLCSGRWVAGRIARAAGWAVAVAALVAMAVGIPLIRHADRKPASIALLPPASPPSPANPNDIANSDVTVGSLIPVELQKNLVTTHEHCVHRQNHHGLDQPGTADTDIAEAMRARLSHAVLMARPADPGWAFRGAAICHVGSMPSGHLVFARGEQAISIFSLPASAAPRLHDGDDARATAKGHPIVAFARDGAIFCLVGSDPSGGISTDDLDQMRQRMEPDVTADATDHSTDLSELLTPIAQ